MVRKNIYFRTTTLWRSLINERLINKINRFIDNNYNEKNEEKDVDKKKKDVDNEIVKLKLFPFSLRDRAKTWFSSLPKNSINSWNKCKDYL